MNKKLKKVPLAEARDADVSRASFVVDGSYGSSGDGSGPYGVHAVYLVVNKC
jgi:hypothetical protein